MDPTTASEASPIVPSHQTSNVALRVRVLTSVASLAEGYDIGITNGAIIRIQADLHLSNLQIGLLIGIPQFGAAVAALASASVADVQGRKLTIALGMLSMAAGNLTMSLATNFTVLMIGRICTYFGLGFSLTCITMYMAEVAPSQSRGMYVSLEELFLNVGILSAMVVAAMLVGLEHDWRIMLAIGSVLPLATALPFFTSYVPESPRFLQNSGRGEEAHVALQELLNGDEVEIKEVLTLWEKEKDIEKLTWPTALRALVSTHKRSALAGIGCAIMATLCGGGILTTLYSSYILTHEANMSDSAAMDASVLIIAVKLISIIFTNAYALDNLGRRPMLLSSSAAMALSYAALSAIFFWMLGFQWVIAGLCFLVVGFSLGFGPAPYPYLAEVFDNQIRAKGVALAVGIARTLGGCIGIAIPISFQAFGPVAVFLAFGVLNILIFLYTYWFCPETMQMSLEKLRDLFREEPNYGSNL